MGEKRKRKVRRSVERPSAATDAEIDNRPGAGGPLKIGKQGDTQGVDWRPKKPAVAPMGARGNTGKLGKWLIGGGKGKVRGRGAGIGPVHS